MLLRQLSGASSPMEKVASMPEVAMSATQMPTSSVPHPKAACLTSTSASSASSSEPGSSLGTCTCVAFTRLSHGCCAAISRLTCASVLRSPVTKSTVSISPGPSRCLETTSASSRGTTPVSDIMYTVPSLSWVTRAGRRPLRSSLAPTILPSENTSSAGPSQASCSVEWNLWKSSTAASSPWGPALRRPFSNAVGTVSIKASSRRRPDLW
mmetsp:Transcript_51738/g.117845  ORF Transcript_51738/g.117845 Transcript_51738/m.117845 type:complete len:210 (+) Transcript_51738:58-687(+)